MRKETKGHRVNQESLDLSRCISIDLEVNEKKSLIGAVGAFRPDNSKSLNLRIESLPDALSKLDRMADGCDFVLGHNIKNFDLKHLESAKPDLRLLKLPVVDTLYLSPLAFPRNPYHHLIKHYKNGALVSTQRNNPEYDARLALELFSDQKKALSGVSNEILTAWHWLTTPDCDRSDRALDALFSQLRKAARPAKEDAMAAIQWVFAYTVCRGEGERIADFICKNVTSVRKHGWQLSFAIAWISVSGGNSVIPPWVRSQFPETGNIVRRLRDYACSDPQCAWCSEHHNAKRQLQRWFQFSDFRSEPVAADGRSMQQSIVEESMAGGHVLGIMPTGAGKSICYQVPALSRYHNTGALTIVISPLVALMADQIEGLRKKGVDCCYTINSLLSMPERADTLDKVRLGDAGVLLISPEQLRSRGLRRVIAQREIGMWVIDEAHCLSSWGHDFRPDYRYVGRFIKEKAASQPIPPVMCLTATAKQDVVAEIKRYFSDNLDIDLKEFNTEPKRSNLEFEIVPTTADKKFADVLMVLQSHLPKNQSGGAIVYCATRRQTEEIAEYLRERNTSVNHFHAGLSPEQKKYVQQDFIEGRLRVITATNAFGMGIDKPDVRVVIHADIPGSLENYLQEAGRAGRDNEAARCVLLYDSDDVERQFSMSARSRLSQPEIEGILKALRKLDRRNSFKEDVIATTGEILLEDDSAEFRRDSMTDDTRVRTAVSWLEDAHLLTREENVVNIFPSSLKIHSLDEASKRLANARISQQQRSELLRIVEILLTSEPDVGVSTDDLMAATKLNFSGVRKALSDLEKLGIATDDMAITAFVHVGVKNHSKKRLKETNALEKALIRVLREEASDVNINEAWPMHLRAASQRLRDEGLRNPLPEKLLSLVRSIAQDGRGEDGGGAGSFSVRKLDWETARVTLLRSWHKLEETAKIRRDAASCLLNYLIRCLPAQSKGVDQLAETTNGELLETIRSDLVISNAVTNHQKLLDRALLWLHEQEVIRLNKGLTVLRSAMLIRVERKNPRKYSKVDFKDLSFHYQRQVLQVHVIKEFAERGVGSVSSALQMALDYFSLKEEEFLDRWLPDRGPELRRETTPESWQLIVKDLRNPVQQKIVADDRVETNVLVLAGPGSGKTRVLIHRIAYLVRVKREDPRSVVALVYNRHAAVEIRKRLADLIGKDSYAVTVLTCHALAMRLVGMTFAGMNDKPDDSMFRDVLKQATSLLRGEDMPNQAEADEQRERLLRGFRWMLIDEYQDIGAQEYDLISALAGRTQGSDSRKLSVFAVGDDDQNIYSFKGASVAFIRRFESDYKSSPTCLTANYRSTEHIISASNALIAAARNRMKVSYPIEIDRHRRKQPKGGEWEQADPVSSGRVQVLSLGGTLESQCSAAITELLRLSECTDQWRWDRCAVIAREWKYLQSIHGLCEMKQIPAQLGNEEVPNFWRIRETQQFVEWLRSLDSKDVSLEQMRTWCKQQSSNRWHDAIIEAIDDCAVETEMDEIAVEQFVEWLAQWGRKYRRRQHGLLLVSAHGAKGLEFDHVAVLDGGWERKDRNEDRDASRRQYYVAMTRAKKTLTLMQCGRNHPFLDSLQDNTSVLWRQVDEDSVWSEALERRYILPALDEVNIGYAGRLHSENQVHKAVAGLSEGDELLVKLNSNGEMQLTNVDGVTVTRLARKFVPPSDMYCYKAEVAAVVRWNKEASDEKYQQGLKCDSWEFIIPRLKFERNRQAQ